VEAGPEVLVSNTSLAYTFRTTPGGVGVGVPKLRSEGSTLVVEMVREAHAWTTTLRYKFDEQGNFIGTDNAGGIYPRAGVDFTNQGGVGALQPIGVFGGKTLHRTNTNQEIGSVFLSGDHAGEFIPQLITNYLYDDVADSYTFEDELSTLMPVGEVISGACLSSDEKMLFVVTQPYVSGASTTDKWYQINNSYSLIAQGTVYPATTGVQSMGYGNPNIPGVAALRDVMTCDDDYRTFYRGWMSGQWQISRTKIDQNGVWNLGDITDKVGISVTGSTPGSITMHKGGVYFVAEDGLYGVIWRDSVDITGVSLANIVADLCLSAKVPVSAIDVSALADTFVKGYSRTGPMEVRAALSPLIHAYNLSAVESDHALKFYRKDGAPNKTLVKEDLAATESESTLPDKLKISRNQDTDIPRRTTVHYSEEDRNYGVGVQYAQRIKT